MDRLPPTSVTPARPGLLPAASLAFLCCAVFAWLLLRNHGLPPAIFADEWYYSKMSRLQPLSEAIVPSYLYLWLFRATNACGDGFLDCVRVGNELFFVASAPFIYAVARKVASRPLSLLIATVALLTPINIYTSFFMPEASYYFGFAVLSWVVLAWRGRDTLRSAAAHGMAAGTVLGLMSLIKVHALFLLPALCLYLVGARRLARGGLAALLAAAVTLALKFGLGWLLAGAEALSVFGSLYSATANAHARRPLTELLWAAWTSGSGHLMAMAVLQALPLALLIQGLASRKMRTQASRALLQLHLYTLLMLGAAAGMTVMFTASIADAAPTEVLRLHLRYYSFVFPLLLMLAAATIGAPWPAAPRALAWPVALLLAVLLFCAAWKLPGYATNAVDGPEIYAVRIDSLPGRIVVGIELLVLLLWACGSRFAAPLFLFVAVPWMTAQGVSSTSVYLRNIDPRSPVDAAGKFAHAYVPAAERKQITVAGTDVIQVMRAQFHIDAPDTGTIGSPQDAPLQPYDMPLRKKWLLVIGHHPLPPGVRPEVATAAYTLVRMDTRRRVIGLSRFNQPLADGGLVDAAEGLSHLESWGRWSETRRIVLHFSRPLPEQANVVIKVQAYGPNAGLPFTMRIGGEEQSFRIQDQPQDVALRFTTDGRQRRLEIDIPKPTAPHDISPSIDTRPLGLGLSEIEISTPDA
jgi:phosphoglycerol transferase